MTDRLIERAQNVDVLMDFRAIKNGTYLKAFIDDVNNFDGLVVADVISTPDDTIIRVWYSLDSTTIEDLQENDIDFWFVKADLETDVWYEYLAVLAKYANDFNDDLMFQY